MNRIAGIVFAAVGLVVAILSILKVVPGLTAAGVVMILVGGLIIGLSFIGRPENDGSEKMSTAGTLFNIFISPSEVFRNLRRHPRFLVAMLVMSILSTIYGNLFLYRMGSDHIVNYTIDKTLEMSMIRDNEDAKKKVEEGRPQALADAKNPAIRTGQAVMGFAGSIVLYAFLALVFFIFALAMGGTVNYWQAFSAAVYSSFAVNVIRFILNTLLLFLKDPSDIHPIRGQSTLIQDNLSFLVLPADHPVIYSILGTLSVLFFYWVWLNATGIKNAGEKVTSTIAWSASLTIYFAIVILVIIASLLFPSFIS